MANNKTLPAVGTGTADIIVATDEIAGADYQLIKLVSGTEDSTERIEGTSANGLEVDITRIAAGDNNIGNVDIVTMPNVTLNEPVTVDGTVTTTPSGDHTVVGKAADGTAVTGNPVLMGGQDGTNVQSLKTDASGELQVDVLTLPALVAGSANIGDVDVLTVPSPLSTAGGGTEATALRVTIASDSTGLVSIDDNGGSITVDGSVTAVASGDHTVVGKAADGAAVSGNPVLIAGQDGTNVQSIHTDTSGDLQVDVLTLPALVAGTANIGDVDIASGPTGSSALQAQGAAAHDAAAVGNPLLNAGTHETPADSAPTNRLASVTDGDVQRLSTVDGALYVIPSGPQQWKARLVGAMTDTTVKSAPGAGLSLYITDIVYSIGAASASSILLEESTTTAVFGPHYLEGVSGRGLAVHFGTPIKIAANTLLSATSTGATTNTLDVYGFTAPG